MDSLRLLMRGSGLEFRNKPDNKHQSVPSAGPQELQPAEDTSSSKKRKRTDLEKNVDASHAISIDEIRKVHHQHKIRITDLRVLHTEDGSESRKMQKQHARLYPQPLQRFSALKDHHVSPALLSNLDEQGYKEPTEVQLATIPLLIEENTEPDLLTIAPTGSGKTLAFMISLINKIRRKQNSQSKDDPNRQVSAIILAPTKELVSQIVNEGRKLAARTGVRVTAFKKGMTLHDDIPLAVADVSEDSEAEAETQAHTHGSVVKSDILVSTPLSLLHAITPTDINDDNSSETRAPLPLPDVETLILDEADILLDTLFREQTLSIWSALTNPSLRTSLWSATIGSNIEEIALSILQARNPNNASTSGQSKTKQKSTALSTPPPLLRVIIGLKDSSLPNISHKLIFASTEPGKLTGLRNLIRPSSATKSILRPPFIIFTQTIPRAQSLYDEIKYDIPASTSPDNPSRIAVLHSSLSSTQRTKIMTNFRLGKIWILITTDLLSRGIDFRGVNGVVNYDIPSTSASYVHRAGRTGRAGREGGVCVTFYTKEDVMYLRPIANVIRKSQKAYGSADSTANGVNGGGEKENGIPDWLLDSLPTLTKGVKKDLKERGVDVRRAVKESDDKKERRRKGRNVIGTKSGYEKKLENNRRDMILGSQRRKTRGQQEDDAGGSSDDEEVDAEFGGFD